MKAQTAVSRAVAYVDALAARWADEKEYEDFSEYKAAAEQFINTQVEGLEFVSLTSNPFRLVVWEGDDLTHRITVGAKSVTVDTLKDDQDPKKEAAATPTTTAKEPIMNADQLATMTLAQLTEIYNGLSDSPIKKFSCSRDAAIAKIIPLLPKPKAKKAPKVEGEVKPRGRGIGARIVELLQGGSKPKEVLETIQAEFEGCTTSIKCVYWYASKLNRGQVVNKTWI